jgi:hypothetical protein
MHNQKMSADGEAQQASRPLGVFAVTLPIFLDVVINCVNY